MELTSGEGFLFLGMVFAAAFLLAQGLIMPAFGENRAARKRFERRMRDLVESAPEPESARRKRAEMSAIERFLRDSAWGARLTLHMEQAGYRRGPQVYLFRWLAGGLAAAAMVWMAVGMPVLAPFAFLLAVLVGVVKLNFDRSKRIAAFEEQLQDATGVMVRALRAGHPFSESIRLVSEDMSEPIAPEFRRVFAEINYGSDVRSAMLRLLSRVPSVMVMALVAAVLVQRETGGNLAETLEKIERVLRGRFQFQRKLRTLSAEARLSAWVLTLWPFGLFITMTIINPGYLPHLTKDALGHQLIGAAFLLMIVGTFWIRQVMRIKV